MSVESIERDFREKVSEQIRLAAEGLGRFRVLTPILFDDGDHLAIVLRRDSTGWVCRTRPIRTCTLATISTRESC